MLLLLFKIIFALFSLSAILTVWQKKQKTLLGNKATFFWIVFWLALTLVVFWPNSTQILADYIGIGRGVDLVIYVSIACIFYLIFKMNLKIEGLKRDLTDVVRTESLESKK
ncbi:MAG: DUF2304 domain-containing protein [Patescibacteria group bacterium]|nr:DUF2304 domain-containing protein [Patescibacteria group bacterium]